MTQPGRRWRRRFLTEIKNKKKNKGENSYETEKRGLFPLF